MVVFRLSLVLPKGRADPSMDHRIAQDTLGDHERDPFPLQPLNETRPLRRSAPQRLPSPRSTGNADLLAIPRQMPPSNVFEPLSCM